MKKVRQLIDRLFKYLSPGTEPIEPGVILPGESNQMLALLIVLPVVGVDILVAGLRGMPVLQCAVFGLAASCLSSWSLKARLFNLERATREKTVEVSAVAFGLSAVLLTVGVLWLPLTVSAGIFLMALGICCLRWGVTACRSLGWSLGFLLLSFPWVDRHETLFGFPFREFLVGIVSLVTKPFLGSLQVQGTSLGSDSFQMVLTNDTGLFWQAQLFLLAAAGLVARSPWTMKRYLIWAGLAGLTALVVYSGFLASLFAINVLSATGPGSAVTAGLEIGWWTAGFAMVFWMAWRGNRSPSTSRPAAVKPDARESMFPDQSPSVAGVVSRK